MPSQMGSLCLPMPNCVLCHLLCKQQREAALAGVQNNGHTVPCCLPSTPTKPWGRGGGEGWEMGHKSLRSLGSFSSVTGTSAQEGSVRKVANVLGGGMTSLNLSFTVALIYSWGPGSNWQQQLLAVTWEQPIARPASTLMPGIQITAAGSWAIPAGLSLSLPQSCKP